MDPHMAEDITTAILLTLFLAGMLLPPLLHRMREKRREPPE